ncbi:hypothetical protein, unknown function [Leishmania infantum JPCM5]|uniref:Uncharacterized protein n=3 Tax=Leishmania donovani species complex TaxID=38574 RepID=A4I1W0_LEIIN|nr:hypothetical protein, unknown function [Leishmania infantum JPCM5]XP_003861611.1 hypothetical protein, unknown function [Leishmania donovani]CAC9495797.1 hypothetical_protein_-_conserved [Leishmania infantum]AYU79622.1 hypothetical protein LdCL_260007700 [Leishmania donovani]TPP41074.1 hypothetical protein CGC21_31525 [Leishmania donovani]CAM68742.1 hypothetical protein, unknown function [Leishmania infantum JPCM5]CBZ34911.1 hypothetical protein, unknown function [Leishmania donovani]|eukprot:XP_001470371.1 hypothetical protein, unknown function [Leishmania infantum JPCM5]
METEGVDKLPLTEASFRALEEAYERQWCQTRLLCEAPTPCADVHVVAAASSAAKHMRRLWADTARLHRRFVEVKQHRDLSFTQEERASLRLLGFRSPPPPPASNDALTHTTSPVPSPVHASNETTASGQATEVAALRKECARLRHEGAQLLSILACYQLRETHALGSNNDARLPSPSQGTSTSASDAYAELAEVQRQYRLLLSPTAAKYSLTPPDGIQRSEDVAIAELLVECGFPRHVSVVRLGSDGLFVIDRPVWITFASPQSATLMVRDPEGLERECTLESYLTAVYAPLLRAFHWQKPSTGVQLAGGSAAPTCSAALSFPAVPVTPAPLSDAVKRERSPSTRHSVLSQLTYEELVELKHATLRRLGRTSEPASQS